VRTRDLARRVSKRLGCEQGDAEAVLRALGVALASQIGDGQVVSLEGFGTWSPVLARPTTLGGPSPRVRFHSHADFVALLQQRRSWFSQKKT